METEEIRDKMNGVASEILPPTLPSMTESAYNRREFLGNSARNAAAAASVLSLGTSPQLELRVGLIGAGQQGRHLGTTIAQIPGVRITALCDVDIKAIGAGLTDLSKVQISSPVVCADYRQLLDRRDVDAVIVATPDHWHARMAMDSLRAEKDLYLETPVAHTIEETREVCKVAAETGRIVQTGLPQRSAPHFHSAIRTLRSGIIGKVHLAKAWAMHRRRSIARCATMAVPPGIDYASWLGPAPKRPFQLNRYNQQWPWFWDYGSGELGLWGVQLLDVIQWGLELELPSRLSATGGCRHFKDDRETPDTLSVQMQFPNVDVIWEHRQWTNHGLEGRMAAAAFYGESGTLVIDRSGWKVYGHPDEPFADSSEMKRAHLLDFVQSVHTRQPAAANLESTSGSTLLCHLANAAYRLKREVAFDPDLDDFDIRAELHA